MIEFILCGVIVLAFATLYISRQIKSQLLFDRLSDGFLLFASFHSLYALISFIIFEDFSFNDIAISFFLAYGPFFYFGVKSIINSNIKKKYLYIHFASPVVFSLLYIIINEAFLEILSAFKVFLCFSVVASVLYYSFLVLFSNRKAYKENIQVRQMVIITGSLLVVLAFFFTGIIINQAFILEANNLKDAESVLYIGLLIFVFVVFRYKIQTFRFYLKQQLNSQNQEVFIENADSKIKKAEIEVVYKETDRANQKYSKSSLNENILNDYSQKLNRLFEEERVYLENDITLEDLAKKMKLSKHHLTQLFNVYLGENFNQYINRYRVNYSCTLLKNHKNDLTIEEIGFESGFNSKVSFNRHFKSYIGCTPSDYLKAL